ncbi:MAG: HAD hydrolase-like protein, partial [Paracoccaceae bacterium]
PHPSMILEAMAETGVTPAQTVMIGDTSFDMDMAASAGVTGFGVSWGYHPVTALGAAQTILHNFDDLDGALDAQWGIPA